MTIDNIYGMTNDSKENKNYSEFPISKSKLVHYLICCVVKALEISFLFLQSNTVSFIKGHSHAKQQHTIHFNCINSAHTHTLILTTQRAR